ncbi:EF-hand domain-containing protein [Parvularcula dongshanensis]|uniref:Ca2+-binding EF-hand superfamily protein n=1 Tax=Parvularcula dongshanensis TaxID=1173995 RepID=A0A840I1P5_9PROT|nr:EF-hand domain-containing protein [Parvularcula dongshanensis]MBB4658739.1 Ca2+-binding EF-hand superfamily protein [Parvularcula dongshanensis]
MMKPICLSVAALCLAGVAVAQESDAPAPQPQPQSVSEAFDEIDADHDGQVVEEEFVAYVGPGTEAQFEAVSGGDGVMTLAELEALVTSGPQTRTQ